MENEMILTTGKLDAIRGSNDKDEIRMALESMMTLAPGTMASLIEDGFDEHQDVIEKYRSLDLL